MMIVFQHMLFKTNITLLARGIDQITPPQSSQLHNVQSELKTFMFPHQVLLECDYFAFMLLFK